MLITSLVYSICNGLYNYMLVCYSDCFVCGKSGGGETLRFGETAR
jgi:hypothetical protein